MSRSPLGIRPASRALALALVAVVVVGCLGRAQDLLDDVNAQIIITGGDPGDELAVEVGDERWDVIVAEQQPVVVYFSLAEGDHDGVVRVQRAEALCAAFTLRVTDALSLEVVSVDVRDAAPCDDGADGGAPEGDAGLDAGPPSEDGGFDPDDGGFDAGPPPRDAGPDAGPPVLDVFLHLEERVTVDPCLELLCLQVTRVEAGGQVTWRDLMAAELSATVPPADVDALATATLSDEADALFAGEDPDCPQPRPLGAGSELERRYLPAGEQTPVVETVGVAGCTGVASELRARLSFLRQLALGL